MIDPRLCSSEVKPSEINTDKPAIPLRLDPFLVLDIGPAKLYLEIWDEPRFGGTRPR